MGDSAEDQCKHLSTIKEDIVPSGDGCKECIEMGDSWVHLRLCMECGHVGCCDDSKNKHATKHFHQTKHPIMFSYEPGEAWGYCYVDDLMFEISEPARDVYKPALSSRNVTKSSFDHHRK